MHKNSNIVQGFMTKCSFLHKKWFFVYGLRSKGPA